MKNPDYKAKVILAWLALIEKYSNHRGQIFFNPNRCDFCKIYWVKRCRGCPFTHNGSYLGCMNLEMLKLASDELKMITCSDHANEFPQGADKSEIFKKISLALKECLPYIKKLPEECFIPGNDNSKFFKFLRRIDKKKAKKISLIG